MIVWDDSQEARWQKFRDDLTARVIAKIDADIMSVPCPAECQNGYLRVFVVGLQPCPLCMGRGRVSVP